MAWWEFGIKGRDGYNSMSISGGLTYHGASIVPDMIGGAGAGSFALDPNALDGSIQRHLLVTTSGGTQVYVETRATDHPDHQFYFPTERDTYKQFECRIVVKKGDSEWFVNTYNTGQFARIIAGSGSIYEYNYRDYSAGLFKDNGNIINPASAFPMSKEGGGTTNQVAMITTATGLEFYVVGYSCVWEDTLTHEPLLWKGPAQYIGKISDSILNNPAWFDPDADAMDPATYYQQQGAGGEGGGDRPVDYEYQGTDVDFPDLPSGASALGFGAMSIFHPTSSALKTALSIIWSMIDLSSLTDLFDTVKDVIVKLIYKPEQYCVSLMLMPLNITGTNKKIYFGKYDTGATAPAIGNQWQIVDCGSLNVPLKSGSSFDFSPYVKTMIYLPYVGFRNINANEIMGGTVYVKYYVDMFTGSALCMVKIANQNSNTSVLYTYECNVAQQVPITAAIYGNIIGTLISASTAVISGNMGAAAAAAGTALNNITPDVQVSGQLNANTGALGSEKPFVAIHFPVQALPGGFENQNGYPSSVNIRLGSLSGYTEVEQIHLHIPGATQNELQYIEDMLHSGVIL